MNANAPLTSDVQQQEDKRRKRKALLAGGLVLGLGAAVTLAAWSDNVFADGTFQTGEFNLLGSQALASTTYADYLEYETDATAADLTTGSTDGGVNFRIDSLNLSPGETVVAPFSVATSQDTTVDGRYWLEDATVTGPLAQWLSFSIVQSATCTADDPTTTANEQTDFTNAWKSHSFTADGQIATFGTVRSAAGNGPDIALEEQFGNQSHLCIGVTLANEETAISSADATGEAGATSILWHFAGESLPLTN